MNAEGVSAPQANANDTKPCISSFYKIIVSPSFQLQNLRIPCAFIHKFGKSLSDHAYLRAPDGAEWKVYLKRHEVDIFFDKGWSEFANRYCLAHSQFIVFKYQGNSKFEIIIFDTTGTEIMCAQNTAINTETGDHISVGMHGESSSAVERAKAFETSNPHFTIAVRPFHLRQPFYFSVPLWYAIEQMKKEKKSTIRLRVEQEGKTWPVNCCFRECRGKTKVYVRWKSFACDNRLKEGDVCVFELINKTTKTYKVTIFRE